MKNLISISDAIFHRQDGVIERHDGFHVIRTPDNPNFWFGNFILFDRPPQEGEVDRWLEAHRQTFGDQLNHVTFAWDEPSPGATRQFLELGFEESNGIALSITEHPEAARTNPELEIRALQSDEDWQAMISQQERIDREDFAYPEGDGLFRKRQMAGARRMAEAGHGDWWGAYLRDLLVGGMGLFFDEHRSLGRFQCVTTVAEFRRKRVCTTLLDHVVRHAFKTVNPAQLIICTGAEEENAAIPVYRNFGFKEAMRGYAVIRKPES
ncbi:MAG: GNAT family N-acetyltransferase [Verrucomicrobiota bacterium]